MQTWIFLRGLIRSADHWGDFPKLWQKSFPDSEVRCLNVPGNGSRFKELSPTTIQAMTNVLRSDKAFQDSKGPRSILALSMGAMIAIDWVTRFPDDFQRAVLINTSAAGSSPVYQRLQWRTIPTMLKIALATKESDRERLILQMTSNRAANDASIEDAWASIAERFPLRRRNAVRQLWAAAQFTVPSLSPKIPVLFLNSAGDRLCNPACSVSLSRRWKAPLETHPNANHELPLDDPKWIIDRVAEWQRQG